MPGGLVADVMARVVLDTGPAIRQLQGEFTAAAARAGKQAGNQLSVGVAGELKGAGKKLGAQEGTGFVSGFKGTLAKLSGAAAKVKVPVDADTAEMGKSLNKAGTDGKKSIAGALGGVASMAGPAILAGFAAVATAAGAALVKGFDSAKLNDAILKVFIQGTTANAATIKQLGKDAGALYASGFGESKEAVALALKDVLQSGIPGDSKDITARVLVVSEILGEDPVELLQAIRNMINTGLVPDAVTGFDLIAKAGKSGLNISADLLDTLEEYSPHFKALGLDGPHALGLIARAQALGIRNTDLLGDAFKELNIRVREGSDETRGAVGALGINYNTLAGDIAAGGPRAAAATDQLLDKLRGIKDPLYQGRLAVMLFGTQAEDIGPKLSQLDISEAAKDFGDFAGEVDKTAQSIAKLPTERMETVKRTAEEFAQTKLSEAFMSGFDWLTEWIDTHQTEIEGLKNTFADIGKFFEEHGDTIKAIGGALLTGITTLISGTLTASLLVGETFLGIVDTLKSLFTEKIPEIWNSFTGWLAETAWPAVTGVFVSAKETIVNVATDIWNSITGAFERAWENIKNTAISSWEWLRDNVFVVFSGVVTGLKDVFNRTVEGLSVAWENIKNAAGSGWAWLRDNVFGAFSSVVSGLKDVFSRTVDGIRVAWDKLKEVAAIPVNFVIDTVYNNGLRKVWNWVADKVGLGQLGPISPIGFASGGRIPGAPSSVDNTWGSLGGAPIGLATGEYVVNAESTRKNLGLLEMINNSRHAFAGGGLIPGFADGGLIEGVLSGARGFLSSAVAKMLGPVRDAVTGGMKSGGFWDLVRNVPARLFDAVTSWVRKDDDDHKLSASFKPWPSGPGAQRGDSGIWRGMLELVKASGIPYQFGNAYRDGDPLWHGSGRAIDFMGYNLDELASFFYSMKSNVLELIHQTNTRSYGVSYGQDWNMGEQFGLHRNHIHVAMREGGQLLMDHQRKAWGDFGLGIYDNGGVLGHGGIGVNRSGKPEAVLTNEQWEWLRKAARGDGVSGAVTQNFYGSTPDTETTVRMRRAARGVLR